MENFGCNYPGILSVSQNIQKKPKGKYPSNEVF